MNILLATSFEVPHPGGLSTHVQLLWRGLESRGHQVRLIEGRQVVCPPWRKAVLLVAAGFNRDRYRALMLRTSVRLLSRRIESDVRKSRPDVIHAHDAFASAAASMSGAASGAAKGVRLIQTVHGPALYEARSALGAAPSAYLSAIEQIERTAFAAADRMIAVDSGQRRILVEDYGVEASRTEVIFNCVDADEIRSLARAPGGLSVAQPYFLVPRRLVPKTGVRHAVEAVSHLKDLDVRLVVAGDGPLRQDLEDLSQKLGVADRVTFLGAVERSKLMPLFAGAAAVVVPSVPSEGVVEATSLAVTEAMAAGSVPLASNIGGLAELIESEVTGLLTPPGDSIALAGAMRRLLSEADLRERLIASASAKVEHEYSLGAWLSRTEATYAPAGTGPVRSPTVARAEA